MGTKLMLYACWETLPHAKQAWIRQQLRLDYFRACALADELSMRPLVAHCHLRLGKLYRRAGKREHAQEHLETATAMYREMDMTYWLEQTEAEIGLLG